MLKKVVHCQGSRCLTKPPNRPLLVNKNAILTTKNKPKNKNHPIVRRVVFKKTI